MPELPMPELRVRSISTANVDASGNARRTRTWHLTNLGSRKLDLTSFRFFLDVPSPDVDPQSLRDSRGTDLVLTTKPLDSDTTRINCDFDLTLEPQQQYAIKLVYWLPRYLKKLQTSSTWQLDESFSRLGPLGDVDFLQSTFYKRSLSS